MLDVRRRTGHQPVVRVLTAATASAGLAAVALVGLDGSPAWQVTRVVATAAVAGVAIAGLSRGGRRLRATIAYVVGLAATSAGIGIGAGHLLKSDTGLDLAAGLLLLTAGLVLLSVGAGALVVSTHRWRRVASAAALLVATFAVVQPSWVAFYVANTPRPGLGTATPADRALAYRDVHFRTPDGVRLAGWYIRSHNGAAVVLRHGSGSTRSAVLGHASVLAKGGYGVLLADARGHGESAGPGMDIGWYGDQDIAGAVSFLTRQPDVDPARIGVVGLSMGGEEAIGAAAGDRRIRAVVAEGATGRTNASARARAK